MTELESCMRDGFSGPTLNDRLIVGIPLAVFTSIGIKLNIALWRIITIKKDIIEPSFRRHVISMIAADIGFNLTAIHTLLPITLFKTVYADWLLISSSTPDSFFYQVIMFSNLTIALDRFLIFAAPRIYEMFSGRKHYILVLPPWIVAAWIVGHSTFLGCYKRFNAYQLRFQYECSICPFYLSFNAYVAIYLPVGILALYFVTFVIIFRKRARLGRELSPKNRDLIIGLQFLIITAIQLAGNFFFNFNFSRDVIIESAVRLSASCWTTYSNPIVMFVFNERVRRSYLHWGRRLWIFKRDLLENGGRISSNGASTRNDK